MEVTLTLLDYQYIIPRDVRSLSLDRRKKYVGEKQGKVRKGSEWNLNQNK
jgi:hypothetical protein